MLCVLLADSAAELLFVSFCRPSLIPVFVSFSTISGQTDTSHLVLYSQVAWLPSSFRMLQVVCSCTSFLYKRRRLYYCNKRKILLGNSLSLHLFLFQIHTTYLHVYRFRLFRDALWLRFWWIGFRLCYLSQSNVHASNGRFFFRIAGLSTINHEQVATTTVKATAMTA